jgi:outer membrane receptor for ferrienterochelin and colicins
VQAGRVVDAATGQPIAGAEVGAIGGARGILTDSTGTWRLLLDAPRLRVRRLGYAPKDVAFAPGVVVALEPLPIALEAVVVTAARREQKLKDAVPETQLISRRDIERAGSSDVSTALAQSTGAQPEAGVPDGAGLYLQGLGSQRVLVLLDGQPLVGRLNGNFDLSRIPSSLVERIEVVRGPQSTLYGSDAMGGVVNIVTRPPAQVAEATVSVTGGTQGRRDAGATLTTTTGNIGVLVDGGARTEALAPGLDADDGSLARRWNVAPRLRWQRHAGTSIELSGLGVGERQRYRTGQLFHFSDNTQLAGRLGMELLRGSRRLAPTLSFSRFDHLSRAATGAQPASDSGQRDVQDLLQAEVVYSAPVPGGMADAGIVARREAITAERVRGTSRSSGAVELYGQGTWAVGALTLSPGVRISHHAQWGDAVTPRIAALLRPVPALALRASVGTGYRSPDFKELYLDFVNAAAGYAVSGNPALRPEHSLNATVGAEVVGERLYGRASAYTNRLRDFIDFGAPDAGGTYTYENIGRATTRGFEVEGGWALGGARLEAGYAWLQARDDSTHAPLLNRSAHIAHLSASGTLAQVSLGATLRFTSRAPTRRDDVTGAITEWHAAMTRLDLRLSAPLPRALGLTAGVDNLFNQQPAGTWPGFTGRRMYVGLTWNSRGS